MIKSHYEKLKRTKDENYPNIDSLMVIIDSSSKYEYVQIEMFMGLTKEK